MFSISVSQNCKIFMIYSVMIGKVKYFKNINFKYFSNRASFQDFTGILKSIYSRFRANRQNSAFPFYYICSGCGNPHEWKLFDNYLMLFCLVTLGLKSLVLESQTQPMRLLRAGNTYFLCTVNKRIKKNAFSIVNLTILAKDLPI